MSEIVLGALEFNSIAAGIKALDAMVKTAPVIIMKALPVSAGKYLILIKGDVASVEYSLNAAKEGRDEFLIDELFLPNLHKGIIPAIEGIVKPDFWDAIGVIETLSFISSIEAGDIAAKVADVTINQIKISVELGGRAYVKMMGELYAVEEAMSTAGEAIKAKGLLYRSEIIANPHPEIEPFFYK